MLIATLVALKLKHLANDVHYLLLVGFDLLLQFGYAFVTILLALAFDNLGGVLFLEPNELGLQMGARQLKRVDFHQPRHLFLNILADERRNTEPSHVSCLV